MCPFYLIVLELLTTESSWRVETNFKAPHYVISSIRMLIFPSELISLFQQMHYTILVFSCPYICFGTPCAILRGVVESSQFSMNPIHFHNI
jgi:hypothetical protein